MGQIQAHETHWTRALVTQARLNLAGSARLHKVIFDKGFLDGPTLWWLDQQELIFVVPAKTNMAVAVDARAQAAAGEGLTRGRRVHTVRHGQGRTARTERLETEVVGITGLTPDDEPTPRRLADLAALVQDRGVLTIYYESLVSPAIAETLAEETGVATAVLDPLEGIDPDDPSASYLSVMRANLAALRAGQPCP